MLQGKSKVYNSAYSKKPTKLSSAVDKSGATAPSSSTSICLCFSQALYKSLKFRVMKTDIVSHEMEGRSDSAGQMRACESQPSLPTSTNQVKV